MKDLNIFGIGLTGGMYVLEEHSWLDEDGDVPAALDGQDTQTGQGEPGAEVEETEVVAA